MKKKLVVLSGAGMSKESGLDTFRDSDGLWAGHNVEDVSSIEGFIRNPKLVLDFYNKRRREMLFHKPNKGHYIIAQLEEFFDITVITQNVDNYHEQAGSSKVIHLHGELMKSRPVNDPYTVYDITEDNIEINLGDTDSNGNQLRPFIVWFGENVPEYDRALREVQECDIFLIIGTSLKVYPAAGLVAYVPAKSKVYIIDPNNVDNGYRTDITHIEKGAVEGMEVLKRILCNN